MEKPWKQRPQSLTDKAGTPAPSVSRPKAWQRWISFPGKVDHLPRVAGSSKTPHASHQGHTALTFSFLQAKAAALFSASALRRPLATKVMGQGQRRVRVASLVLVPTVWNCMRFYKRGGEGLTRRQGTGTSKCSQSAEEPRYRFNPHLSRHQTSATKEVPLNRQKRAL